MFTRQPVPRQGGISFIELIIFILVVGIAVTSLLGVISRSASASADPLRRKQALMIAESLMEEVMMARFTFCDAGDANVETATAATALQCPDNVEAFGPEPGNARPFDNVNDYVGANGVVNASAFQNGAGALVDVNGTAFPSNYTASLVITQTSLNGVAANASLKISITVTDTLTQTAQTVQSFRLQYAPNSPP